MYLSITAGNTRGSIRGLNGLAASAVCVIFNSNLFQEILGVCIPSFTKTPNFIINKCFLAEEVKRSTVHTGFINLIYMNPP